MATRAQQHGGVRFCRAPRQPEQNSMAGVAFTGRAAWAPGHPRSPCALGGWFFLPCFVPAAAGVALRNARLGFWAPFGPVWPRRAPHGSRAHTSAGATARWRALVPSAFF